VTAKQSASCVLLLQFLFCSPYTLRFAISLSFPLFASSFLFSQLLTFLTQIPPPFFVNFFSMEKLKVWLSIPSPVDTFGAACFWKDAPLEEVVITCLFLLAASRVFPSRGDARKVSNRCWYNSTLRSFFAIFLTSPSISSPP